MTFETPDRTRECATPYCPLPCTGDETLVVLTRIDVRERALVVDRHVAGSRCVRAHDRLYARRSVRIAQLVEQRAINEQRMSVPTPRCRPNHEGMRVPIA